MSYRSTTTIRSLAFFFCLFIEAVSAQPLLILNTTGQPPLNTPEQDGFVDAVLTEAVKRVGYQLEIYKLPAERGLRSANSGMIDGEMTRIAGINKLYTNLIRVPEKVMDWEFCVFSKSAIDLQLGWDSLAGEKVAFITGWKILETRVPSSAFVTKVKNSEQLFNLLTRDYVDFVIYEYWGGNHILRNRNLKTVNVQRPRLASREMYVYLHKKHEALIPVLSNALADMKRDGSYEVLVKKHLDILVAETH